MKMPNRLTMTLAVGAMLLLSTGQPIEAQLPSTPDPNDVPQNLHISEYNAYSGHMNISWEPPINAQEWTYTIYQHGKPLVRALEKTYKELVVPTSGVLIFHVTATDPTGKESLPSEPLYAASSPNGVIIPCIPPGKFWILKPPFILKVDVYEQCLPISPPPSSLLPTTPEDP